MRPIPSALLPHAATLAIAAADAYQTETLTPVANLTRVRVEPLAEHTRTPEETRLRLTATLWYDARRSLPRNVAFAVGQRVLFENGRYRVESVARYDDGRRTHHLEIGLSGPA